MRSTFMLALAFAPALLHAQAIQPAQPQTGAAASLLESKLVAPAVPADRTTVAAPRISTGIIAPKLISVVDVPTEITVRWMTAGRSRSAVVSMIVDKDGKPTDLKIAQSAGSDLDKNILASVSQYRFQPATVSNMPVNMPVMLTVNVLNPYQR
ncbi:MAG TPA: TonB family protein [Granulicella sp.]